MKRNLLNTQYSLLNTRAFTIAEIIIVIAVIIILAAAAITGSAGLIRTLRFNNAFNKMIFMVQQARSLAVTGKNSEVKQYRILFDKNASPEKITLFGDLNENLTIDADETIESFSLETTTNLNLTLQNLVTNNPCPFVILSFNNGNGDTSIHCNGTGNSNMINNVRIGLNETVDGSVARSKTFSIHRASGIPQL